MTEKIDMTKEKCGFCDTNFTAGEMYGNYGNTYADGTKDNFFVHDKCHKEVMQELPLDMSGQEFLMISGILRRLVTSAREETAREIFKLLAEETWSFHKREFQICSVCKEKVFVIYDGLDYKTCYRCALKKLQDNFIKSKNKKVER